jgi:hypothetical protein
MRARDVPQKAENNNTACKQNFAGFEITQNLGHI